MIYRQVIGAMGRTEPSNAWWESACAGILPEGQEAGGKGDVVLVEPAGDLTGMGEWSNKHRKRKRKPTLFGQPTRL